MHLEMRSREFMEALGSLQSDRILALCAPRTRYDFPGVLDLADRGALRGFLEAVRHNMASMGIPGITFRVLEVAAAGTRTFVQWECVSHRAGGDVLFRGVHVLVWDGQGRVERASVYTDAEAVRRMAVGMAAYAGEGLSERTPAALDPAPLAQ